jgi:hypothetical protein
MRTIISQTTENNSNKLFRAKNLIRGIALLFILTTAGLNTTVNAQDIQISASINLPGWAPYYENQSQVRYYYLPDIEAYYDIRSQEFVYLYNGLWVFSRSLPPAYAWFNLNNCFVVALDYRVFEPWRHFNYYVGHYPRYYYHSKYNNRRWDNDRPLRGFNENERREVFNHRADRDYYNSRERSGDYRNDSHNRNDNYNHNDNYNRNDNNRNDNRSYDAGRNNNNQRGAGPSERTAPVQYNGKKVGKPVKVQKDMREHGGQNNKENNQGSGHRQK